MAKLRGNKRISFVSGDTFQYNIKIKEELCPAVEKIVFCCKALDMNQEMEEVGKGKYKIVIGGDVTANIKNLKATYDIIVFFTDNKNLTDTGNRLTVEMRRNPKVE